MDVVPGESSRRREATHRVKPQIRPRQKVDQRSNRRHRQSPRLKQIAQPALAFRSGATAQLVASQPQRMQEQKRRQENALCLVDSDRPNSTAESPPSADAASAAPADTPTSKAPASPSPAHRSRTARHGKMPRCQNSQPCCGQCPGSPKASSQKKHHCNQRSRQHAPATHRFAVFRSPQRPMSFHKTASASRFPTDNHGDGANATTAPKQRL